MTKRDYYEASLRSLPSERRLVTAVNRYLEDGVLASLLYRVVRLGIDTEVKDFPDKKTFRDLLLSVKLPLYEVAKGARSEEDFRSLLRALLGG
jgi:hypothetical protein